MCLSSSPQLTFAIAYLIQYKWDWHHFSLSPVLTWTAIFPLWYASQILRDLWSAPFASKFHSASSGVGGGKVLYVHVRCVVILCRTDLVITIFFLLIATQEEKYGGPRHRFTSNQIECRISHSLLLKSNSITVFIVCVHAGCSVLQGNIIYNWCQHYWKVMQSSYIQRTCVNIPIPNWVLIVKIWKVG